MLKSWVVGVVSAILIAASGPALAQEATPPAEQAKPAAAPAQEAQVSQEQVDRAVLILETIVMAFGDSKISLEDKTALLACTYNHSLGAINLAVGEVMAAALKNYEAGVADTKFDPSNPQHLLHALGLTCEVPSLQTQP